MSRAGAQGSEAHLDLDGGGLWASARDLSPPGPGPGEGKGKEGQREGRSREGREGQRGPGFRLRKRQVGKGARRHGHLKTEAEAG